MIKILIIDDEAPIRNVLKIHLQNASYEVMDSSTGKEGIDIALSNDIDLVLCDLKLTDMSGLDIIRSLRLSKKEMPIIAISGFINDEVIEAVSSIENVRYLSKPFLKEELLSAIDDILELS
ncbi:MAG: response regulator [Proteobacteria bacterium]|nr:response regulator [Pseudomonadota bacterium]